MQIFVSGLINGNVLESSSISSQQLRQELASVLDAQLVSRDESLALNLAGSKSHGIGE